MKILSNIKIFYRGYQNCEQITFSLGEYRGEYSSLVLVESSATGEFESRPYKYPIFKSIIPIGPTIGQNFEQKHPNFHDFSKIPWLKLGETLNFEKSTHSFCIL